MINPIYLNVLQTNMLGLIGVAVSPQGLLRLRKLMDDPQIPMKDLEGTLLLERRAHGERGQSLLGCGLLGPLAGDDGRVAPV